MKRSSETRAEGAVREAASYLRSCGIRLPRFSGTAEPPGDLAGLWKCGRIHGLARMT